jgi:hypothetical protein
MVDVTQQKTELHILQADFRTMRSERVEREHDQSERQATHAAMVAYTRATIAQSIELLDRIRGTRRASGLY